MSSEKIKTLALKLEQLAQRHPQSYKRGVFLFALLGYAYPLALLLGFIAGMVLLFFPMMNAFADNREFMRLFLVAIEIGLFVLTLLIANALWVKFKKPDGYHLAPAEAPALFAFIEEIRRDVGGPRIQTILIGDNFNAGVHRIPRLGIFGWNKNYLMLGLYLMEVLSKEELRAVIAHEFAHLYPRENWLQGWIFRMEQTWVQLEEQTKGDASIVKVMWKWFMNWYFPRFNACCAILLRENERNADKVSASYVHKEICADALVNSEVYPMFLVKKFWHGIFRLADANPEPPKEVYALMEEAFRSVEFENLKNEYLRKILSRRTRTWDIHPCLRDRLNGIGVNPDKIQANPPPPLSAADELLGERKIHYSSLFSKTWRAHIIGQWRNRHEQVQKGLENLKKLEEQKATRSLALNDEWQMAFINAEYKDHQNAITIMKSFLDSHPDHAEGNFYLGQTLIDMDDDLAIAFLEKAMKMDSDKIIPSCEMIQEFLWDMGRNEEAERYQERIKDYHKTAALAREERTGISRKDFLDPPELPEDEWESLRQIFSRLTYVKAAYVVKKEVVHFPDKPCHIIVLELKSEFFESPESQILKVRQVYDMLGRRYGTVSMPAFIGNRIRNMKGALIYKA